MNRIEIILADKKVIVSDGAMGTMLDKAGIQPGVIPETWNVDNPDAVMDVSLQYILAGSDMVLTNSFGVHPVKLAKANLAGRTEEFTRLAVELARKAAKDAGADAALASRTDAPHPETSAPSHHSESGVSLPNEPNLGAAKEGGC